jgi:site-specific DNA recombinase
VADAAGFHGGGKEPPKRLVPDPETAPLVRRAFDLFAEGSTVAQVSAYLKSVSDRTWGYDTVKRLLGNEVYRGALRFGKWINHTAHEAIVSEALWDRAQEALTRRARTRAPKRKPKDTTPYYLRGRVFCPHCGCRMTPADHHGRAAAVRYYECTSTHKGKSHGCPVVRVNAHALHEAVLGEIRRAAEHPTRTEEMIREAVKALPERDRDWETDLKAVARRLRDAERQVARLTDVIASSNSKTPMAPLLRRLDELEGQRRDLEQEHERLTREAEAAKVRRPDAEQVRRLWGRTLELWEEATEEERAQFLGLLVERVEMQDKEHGVCRLVFSTETPCSNVGLTSRMGAGLVPGSIYPECLWFLFEA